MERSNLFVPYMGFDIRISDELHQIAQQYSVNDLKYGFTSENWCQTFRTIISKLGKPTARSIYDFASIFMDNYGPVMSEVYKWQYCLDRLSKRRHGNGLLALPQAKKKQLKQRYREFNQALGKISSIQFESEKIPATAWEEYLVAQQEAGTHIFVLASVQAYFYEKFRFWYDLQHLLTPAELAKLEEWAQVIAERHNRDKPDLFKFQYIYIPPSKLRFSDQTLLPQRHGEHGEKIIS